MDALVFIGEILDSYKAHPDIWAEAEKMIQGRAEPDHTWWDCYARCNQLVLTTTVQEIRSIFCSYSDIISKENVYTMARDAAIALLTDKDYTHILHWEPEEVLLLAGLGVPEADMLYPVVIVNNLIAQKQK